MKLRAHNKILTLIAEQIQLALKEEYNLIELSIIEIFKQLSLAPNFKMGHIAFACFPFAKDLKKAPAEISKSLKNKIDSRNFSLKSISAGPYLNFFIDGNSFGEHIATDIENDVFFTAPLFDNTPKTMVEYSQPNTHKVLHVGHMRNLCLGNALIEILRYSGQEVISATYPGDVGTHVAKCLWYVKNRYSGDLPTENKGAWLGNIYASANKLLEDEKGTEKEDQNRSELTAILKEIESAKGEYYELWRETRQWSIDLMNKAYQWANIKFDRWFFESEVDAPSVKYAKELEEKGFLVEDQGAIGMRFEDEKLGFCILIKSDGTGLYSTKDVELARKKFEEFKIDKNVYIVDKRQAFHFQQVFKVLEKIGFEKAKDCYHLQYDFVELPDGAMSSRKGNIVPLMDLISNMEKTIIDQYLEKYRGQWSDMEINETARIVANGAIKYGMVRMDNNRKIVFDMNEWLKLDGETGPYLQYVCARINSLCLKQNFNKEQRVNWNLLVQPQEIELMVKILMFNNVVAQAAEQYKTSGLCSYLYELGKHYNSFYAECPIAKAETEDLAKSRLALSHACFKTMSKGLSLLGIPTPLKM